MALVHRRVVKDLPVFDRSPFEALDVDAESEKSGEQDNSLDSILLPLVMFRLSCPVQEGGDIFRHLRRGSGGTIIILDNAIKQYSSHGDSAPGKNGL